MSKPKSMNRREFLTKTTAAASVATMMGVSFEEEALLSRPATASTPAEEAKPDFPVGKIGDVTISRILCGGNLVGGWAHSRDLMYVSPLVKAYHTHEKIFETWRLCEERGINTVTLNHRNREESIPILSRYWNEWGGEIQWLAQCNPNSKDVQTNLKTAIDGGAVGCFVQGGISDLWVQKGRVDLLAEAVEFIQSQGVIAGVACHAIEVPMAVEKAGVNPDFYMKTLHTGNYWSAQPPDVRPRFGAEKLHDNMWSLHPEETTDFMAKVKQPWIAYKVLAAGSIPPEEGFQYVFDNGVDFAAVGMFDFQVAEDAIIAKKVLANVNRKRPWRG